MHRLGAFLRPNRFRAAGVLCAISACTLHAAPLPWERDQWLPAPPDLQLTDDRARLAEALASYGWAVYLSRSPVRDQAEVQRLLLRALDLEPEADAVLREFVSPFLVTRDYDSLLHRLRPIAERHPEAANLQLVVAEAMSAGGDAAGAIRYLEGCLARVHYASPPIFRQLLIYLWDRKQFRKAEALVRRVMRVRKMRQDPMALASAAVFWRTWANQPEVKKHPERRKRFIERSVRFARQAAGMVTGHTNLADVRALAGVLVDAEYYDDAARMLRKIVGFHDHATDLKLLLADTLLRAGKKTEGIEVLDDVLRRPMLHPRQSTELGRLYIEADAPEKAALAYERALVLDRKNLRLRLMLAFLYLHLDQPDRCLELTEGLNKPAAQVHLLRSRAWYRKRELKKAARELALAENAAREAGDEHFFSVDFELYYATVCEDMGLTDRALEHARKALSMAPDDPTCLNFVGYVLADHNRKLDEAERLIRRAVEAEPENVAYLDSLAWVLYRKQRTREALEVMNRCLRLGGEDADPVILDHAGDINAAAGFPLLAKVYWRLALDAAEDPKLQQNLRRKLGLAPQKKPTPPLSDAPEKNRG